MSLGRRYSFDGSRAMFFCQAPVICSFERANIPHMPRLIDIESFEREKIFWFKKKSYSLSNDCFLKFQVNMSVVQSLSRCEFLSACLSVVSAVCRSFVLSVCLSVLSAVFLSVGRLVRLSVHLKCCLSVGRLHFLPACL